MENFVMICEISYQSLRSFLITVCHLRGAGVVHSHSYVATQGSVVSVVSLDIPPFKIINVREKFKKLKF